MAISDADIGMPCAEDAAVDSSEDDVSLDEESPTPAPKTKRRRGREIHRGSPKKMQLASLASHQSQMDVGGYAQPRLWVPGHFMEGGPAGIPVQYIESGPPSAYPSPSGARRQKRSASQMDWTAARPKPARVEILENGDIDQSCEGKPAWDEAVCTVVPTILDMSVVEWGKQKSKAVQKLKEALDEEFEYVGHPLSMLGLRTSITRFLKAERSRLKARWLKGNTTCPSRVNPEQWKRLVAYWETPAQVAKSSKMSEARQGLGNQKSVQRKAKSGGPSQVVRMPSSHRRTLLSFVFHFVFLFKCGEGQVVLVHV